MELAGWAGIPEQASEDLDLSFDCVSFLLCDSE